MHVVNSYSCLSSSSTVAQCCG